MSSYATAHEWYAWYFVTKGQSDQAIEKANQALALDPLSLIINAVLGWVHYWARQYDLAIEQFQKTLELDSDFPWACSWLGQSYLQKREFQEAITALQNATTHSSGSAQYLATLGHAYALANRRQDALEILNQLNELSKQRFVSPYDRALIYAGLAEKNQAIAWLQRAYLERTGWLTLLKADPRFDSVRAEPEFTDLMRLICVDG